MEKKWEIIDATGAMRSLHPVVHTVETYNEACDFIAVVRADKSHKHHEANLKIRGLGADRADPDRDLADIMEDIMNQDYLV